MTDLRRRELLKWAGTTGALGAAGAVDSVVRGGHEDDTPIAQPERPPPEEYDDYSVLRVPEDHDSIQDAVEAAEPRDLVSVGAGVYNEAVEVLDTPRLTIRGRDRNEVVLDGEFQRRNGIFTTSHGVVMENMTARNYNYNGFYWSNVEGYRGSYLTAYNNGDYGIYAFSSVHGRFDNCYASGHPDSGFYIGQCEPCHAIIDNVVAEHNCLGYSGTNAGGYVTLKNSVWRNNMAGIVPNTLDSEDLAPQSGIRIEHNEVRNNNNDQAAAKPLNFPAFGTGITVAGGSNNEIRDNVVHDHVNFGVLVTPMIDDNLWVPGHNEVRHNSVHHSGRADLALGTPNADGNCFSNNDFGTSRPARIQGRHGCGGASLLGRLVGGDLWPTLVLGKSAIMAEFGDVPGGDWKDQPEPDPQPTMPDPERPPREPVGDRE